MKILIDIGHPAHVHLFRLFAREMLDREHKVLFTCRDKEFEIYLLKHYHLPYKSFGKKYNSTFGKILGMVKFDFKMLLTVLKFKPQILLSHGSMYAAHASFVTNRIHIALEDTFNFEQIRLYKPFTKHILTADYEHTLKTPKVIEYAGYHELAYLHPRRFNPNIEALEKLGVNSNEIYTIIRFVSWNASHDRGHQGITFENKLEAVRKFEQFGKVFISSEGELPKELEKYRLKIEPHNIHDAIAFATLLFGESSTMSEEAAMLGVPSVYLFNNNTLYTKHLEAEYSLIYNYDETTQDQTKAIEKGVELLKTESIKREWKEKTQKMLSEKIDVTAFMVWFIENYPKSAKIMKENPDYQYRFK